MTDTRINQAGLEAWITNEPEARIRQVGLEVWASTAVGSTEAQIFQVGLEVWVLADINRRRVVNAYYL